MLAVQRVLHFLTHALSRAFPSRYGNDGLTYLERRHHTANYRATVGHRPPVTEQRLAELHKFAEKTPGRVWHRPGLDARSA